jgi:hypothetical protein
VALWWSYNALLEHDLYKALNDTELLCLLLLPNLLGGFPIIYLHNFFVRAESDLLPPFLDLLKYTLTYNPDIHTKLSNALIQDLKTSEDCFTALLIDPYSLPLNVPQTPQAILRTEVARLIKSKTKNEALKDLFLAQDDDFTKNLISRLYQAKTWNARLFSAIYDTTPDGIIRELTKKFESGRSV